jgi:RimJ/RimL family protein N-acetyltransferase
MKRKYTPIPGENAASLTRKSKTLLVRYPKHSDWRQAWFYINELSLEKTYILLQGEHISQAFEKRYIQSLIKQVTCGKAVHLFIFSGKQIVGIGGITLKEHVESHVGTLAISIHYEYRDQGLGSWLLETLLLEAKKRLLDIKVVTLEVFENNPRARRLYEKMGFIQYGKLPHGIHHRNKLVDSVLMYRTI